MKRSLRSTLARETVAICEAGSYTNARGRVVTLAPAIRDSIEATAVYSPGDIPAHPSAGGPSPTRLPVTNETTTSALRRLHAQPGGHLACLNFASARNPGGGFLNGSEAQEESLARASALYPSLLAAPEYYERNRASPSALYLDLAIWSPAVPFFRDDEGALLEEYYCASVITSPAPNAGAVANNAPQDLDKVTPTLRRRANFVLALAAAQEVRRLVLGAWGCGVFRNDPAIVAETFAELLCSGGRFSSTFDEVVFAIYDRSAGQQVFRAFAETFR